MKLYKYLNEKDEKIDNLEFEEDFDLGLEDEKDEYNNMYGGKRRSINIKKDGVYNLVKNKCSNVLSYYQKENSIKIFRGLPRGGDSFLYIEPSKSDRVSRNTSNFYTLLIDNSKEWSSYPKRSKSIICSTDENRARDYGITYLVFPFNNSKIGICPTQDIWFSTEDKYNQDLDVFNGIILSFLQSLKIKINSNEKEWNNFKKCLDKAEKFIKNFDKKEFEETMEVFNELDNFTYNKKITLYENLMSILNPIRLKFKLKKAGEDLPKRREVWTDGNSVLVDLDEVIDMFGIDV